MRQLNVASIEAMVEKETWIKFSEFSQTLPRNNSEALHGLNNSSQGLT